MCSIIKMYKRKSVKHGYYIFGLITRLNATPKKHVL